MGTRFHGFLDGGQRYRNVSFRFDSSWVRGALPTCYGGQGDWGESASLSVDLLAPGYRRAYFAGGPHGGSRHSHGIPPVLARVWLGIIELFNDASFDSTA